MSLLYPYNKLKLSYGRRPGESKNELINGSRLTSNFKSLAPGLHGVDGYRVFMNDFSVEEAQKLKSTYVNKRDRLLKSQIKPYLQSLLPTPEQPPVREGKEIENPIFDINALIRSKGENLSPVDLAKIDFQKQYDNFKRELSNLRANKANSQFIEKFEQENLKLLTDKYNSIKLHVAQQKQNEQERLSNRNMSFEDELALERSMQPLPVPEGVDPELTRNLDQFEGELAEEDLSKLLTPIKLPENMGEGIPEEAQRVGKEIVDDMFNYESDEETPEEALGLNWSIPAEDEPEEDIKERGFISNLMKDPAAFRANILYIREKASRFGENNPLQKKADREYKTINTVINTVMEDPQKPKGLTEEQVKNYWKYGLSLIGRDNKGRPKYTCALCDRKPDCLLPGIIKHFKNPAKNHGGKYAQLQVKDE